MARFAEDAKRLHIHLRGALKQSGWALLVQCTEGTIVCYFTGALLGSSEINNNEPGEAAGVLM